MVEIISKLSLGIIEKIMFDVAKSSNHEMLS